MRAEHVKGVSKVRVVQIAVPPPVCIGVGEMPSAGTVRDAVFPTMADLMAVGGSMGMDTGAVAREGNAIRRDKAVLKGRKECGEAEKVLESFLIMEGEGFMFQCISGKDVGNTGMTVGKLLTFAGLFEKLCVLIFREKVFPAGFLGSFWLGPEPVDKVEVRAQRR